MDLKALISLEAAATPRPWRVSSYPSGTVNVELPNGFWFASTPRTNCVGSGELTEDDCQTTRTLDSHLIRELRNLAPELLALWQAAEALDGTKENGKGLSGLPEFWVSIANLNAKAAAL